MWPRKNAEHVQRIREIQNPRIEEDLPNKPFLEPHQQGSLLTLQQEPLSPQLSVALVTPGLGWCLGAEPAGGKASSPTPRQIPGVHGGKSLP